MTKFWSRFHFQILWYSFTWDNRFLITLSLISHRKILPPTLLDTSTTALVCTFSSILNSMVKGWKYRSRELLKAIFYHQKRKKFLEICMTFFSDIYMKCLNPQVTINKMVNEHTGDYHTSLSELTSRIHLLIFLRIPNGFIFSPECFLNFFSNLYFAPCFKFMVLRLLENAFVSQKVESVHFDLCH